MGRRGRSEGAIYQTADGRWRGSVSLGVDASGRRLRRYVSGRLKREVQEKLQKLQARVATGATLEPSRVTVAEYLDAWLEESPPENPNTLASYENACRVHIKPRLGALQLSALRPLHVDAFYAELARAKAGARGSSDGARTRENVHAVFHIAMKRAVRLGYLIANPCDAVERPKSERREMSTWTPKHARVFLAAAERDRLAAMYLLAIVAGLRQGELFGLKWPDIDLDAAHVSVQRGLREVKGKHSEGAPKTKKSRRRIELPAIAVEALRRHHTAMRAEFRGRLPEHVFVDTEGGRLRKSNVRRRSFGPLLAAAKVPQIRFHDLRHTCATLLLSEGVHPKVVQERLGHSRIATTLDTYSHVLPTMQAEASGRLETMLTDRIADGERQPIGSQSDANGRHARPRSGRSKTRKAW